MVTTSLRTVGLVSQVGGLCPNFSLNCIAISRDIAKYYKDVDIWFKRKIMGLLNPRLMFPFWARCVTFQNSYTLNCQLRTPALYIVLILGYGLITTGLRIDRFSIWIAERIHPNLLIMELCYCWVVGEVFLYMTVLDFLWSNITYNCGMEYLKSH